MSIHNNAYANMDEYQRMPHQAKRAI
ncbi:unnamed protein product, partial [Rotaria socialis]